MREPIPAFDIYGQSPRDPEPGFFHVERISDRSALHGGVVRPHRHTHLDQLSCWTGTGGDLTVDGETHGVDGATLTIMPAGIVHGFAIPAGTDAIVASISGDFHAHILGEDERELRGLLHRPAVIRLDGPAARRARRLFREIEAEYATPRAGQASMIAAALKLVLVLALRGDANLTDVPATARRRLFERFVTASERHFRERWPVARYVSELGSTAYLLNACTRDMTGLTASDLLDRRMLLEAKRLLLYTMLGASEIAFTLGFDDASHFSRTFRRLSGQAPTAWRTSRIGDAAGGAMDAP